jgi:hypothetical protein
MKRDPLSRRHVLQANSMPAEPQQDKTADPSDPAPHAARESRRRTDVLQHAPREPTLGRWMCILMLRMLDALFSTSVASTMYGRPAPHSKPSKEGFNYGRPECARCQVLSQGRREEHMPSTVTSGFPGFTGKCPLHKLQHAEAGAAWQGSCTACSCAAWTCWPWPPCPPASGKSPWRSQRARAPLTLAARHDLVARELVEAALVLVAWVALLQLFHHLVPAEPASQGAN